MNFAFELRADAMIFVRPAEPNQASHLSQVRQPDETPATLVKPGVSPVAVATVR